MMYKVKPRLFKLIRHKDGKNISGTGKVIDGVVFADGRTVVEWQGERSSISIFNNLEDFQQIHTKPIYNENEFIWYDGYKPSDEVNDACDQLVEFVLGYSGGRISDRTKGEIVAKIISIKKSHERQQRGGFSASTERSIVRNQKEAVRLAHLSKQEKEL